MSDKERYTEELPIEGLIYADGGIPAEENSIVGSFASDSLYKKTLQGTPMHGLIASSTAPQTMQINAVTRAGEMNIGGVAIVIDEEVIPIFTPQAFKVFIMLITAATEHLPRENQITPEAILRSRMIKITLDDYMRLCKIRDKKNAREQLNAAIRSLYGISLDWYETEYNKPEGKSRKVKERIHYSTRILDKIGTREGGKPVRSGAAEVQLAYDMAKYLAGAYIMYYPSDLLAINTQYHPYSVQLGWKLCALYNMNWGKPTQGKTTVSTLLKAANGIPRYEKIAETGQVYDRIIKPFDRDMRELVERGILSDYYYYDDMGARVDNIGSISYLTFSGLNVAYTIKDYPDQAPRIEAKQKRISAAISRRKREADKRKRAEAEQIPGQITMQEALS
jgi:hypothetical protein